MFLVVVAGRFEIARATDPEQLAVRFVETDQIVRLAEQIHLVADDNRRSCAHPAAVERGVWSRQGDAPCDAALLIFAFSPGVTRRSSRFHPFARSMFIRFPIWAGGLPLIQRRACPTTV